jgi:copper(I)-binding protein
VALAIDQSWARPTAAAVKTEAGWMAITNTRPADDRLTGVSSPRSKRVEIHRTETKEDLAHAPATSCGPSKEAW